MWKLTQLSPIDNPSNLLPMHGPTDPWHAAKFPQPAPAPQMMTGREAWSQWQSDAVRRPDATEAAPQPEPINAEARALFEGHLRT